LQAHVQLPWIEQEAANDRVLKILEGPTHKDWLDKHGVRPLIEELRSGHDAFAAALKARDAETVPSGDAIKDARELGQELYLEIVAQIITLSTGKPELRRELLEPVWYQNQRVQMYRRQRRNLVDVNPDTGEELPEPTDGSGNAGGTGGGSPPPATE
jgi:hypothetical protein